MGKKSKYTLFPLPPSPPPSQPLPPLPEETSELPPQRQHKQEPSWPPPAGSFQPPTNQDPSYLPPRRKSSAPLALDPYLPPPRDPRRPSPREPATQSPRNLSPTAEDEQPPEAMHSPSSSTSSEASFHKPQPPAFHTPPPSRQSRPKTVYFHTGLGGAGNYHKAIREDNILRTTVSSQQRSKRLLSSLFGSKKGSKRSQYPESDSSGYSQTSLGAAEVMRRKMLGYGSDGKGTSSSRN
ncbi:hypothetical protein N7G274_008242 [Stereocaulon virgatum]|uniref:Uncharacterized protein n=1 Tax=Stereocaulon virgatum TaxID=373712 RepID=A0ABR4A0Q2_9LECA